MFWHLIIELEYERIQKFERQVILHHVIKALKRILQLGLSFNSDPRLLTEKMYDKESATNNSAGVIQTITKCCYL